MSEIKLVAFAQAATYFGREALQVTIQPGETIAAMLTRLHPEGLRNLPGTRVAVNLDFANLDDVLQGGETVALIPPVSGG